MQFLGREITDVTFESMLVEESGRALSGRKWTSATRAQYWRLVVRLQASYHDSPQAAMRVFAKQAARRGSEQFQFPMPQPPVGSNSLGGKSVQAATAGKLALGFSGGGSLNVDAGRFIKFGNHSKIYIVEDSTATVLTVFPGLVSQVPAGTTVNLAPNLNCQYSGLARLQFQAGRGSPTLILEEVI